MSANLAAITLTSCLAVFAHAQDRPPSQPSSGQPPDTQPQIVVIEAVRTPLSIKLDSFVRGIEAFKAGRHRAPNAKLRFVFWSSRQNVGPLRLWLERAEVRTPIDVDYHGEFSIPIGSPGMIAESTLVVNREIGSDKIRPVVRTNGFEGDDRRLGDLRLECSVLWEMEKESLSLFARAAFGAVGGACASSRVAFSFPSARKILYGRVLDGDLTADVKVLQEGRGYWPPMHDLTLEDNAVVQFTFADA